MARQRQSSNSISESLTKILSPTVAISGDLPPRLVNELLQFFADFGVTAVIPGHCDAKKDFYSDVLTDALKPLRIEPGSISCLLTAEPSILYFYATIHAGAVAAVAEAVSIACARTVFPEEKEIFLGEMSISYLSGAPKNVCLILSGPLTCFFKGRGYD